ncbi:MAG: MotA/TolQ/ExbB proton channel family protein [Candidatus Competibacterales bacterium]
MSNREPLIFRHALAWTLVVTGILLIIAAQVEPNCAARGDSHESIYLIGVLQRSLCNTYQLVLLSAWIALLPHWLVLITLFSDNQVVRDYGNFSTWAQTVFTSLGFLGTIVGISMAVAGLEKAMSQDNPGELINGLSTAFDTTFLGLGGAITILVLRKIGDLWSP